MTLNIQNLINQYKYYILLFIIMILFILNNKNNNKNLNKKKNKKTKGGKIRRQRNVSNSLNLDIDTSMYDTPSDFIDDRINKIKKNINRKIKIKSAKNQVSKKIKNIRNNINLSTIPETLETESEIIQEPVSIINPQQINRNQNAFQIGNIVEIRQNEAQKQALIFIIKEFNNQNNLYRLNKLKDKELPISILQTSDPSYESAPLDPPAEPPDLSNQPPDPSDEPPVPPSDSSNTIADPNLINYNDIFVSEDELILVAKTYDQYKQLFDDLQTDPEFNTFMNDINGLGISEIKPNTALYSNQLYSIIFDNRFKYTNIKQHSDIDNKFVKALDDINNSSESLLIRTIKSNKFKADKIKELNINYFKNIKIKKNTSNVNFEFYVNELYKVYQSVNVLQDTIINDYHLPDNTCLSLTENYKKMCNAPVLNKNECKDILLSQAQINREKAKKELEQAHETLKLVSDLN